MEKETRMKILSEMPKDGQFVAVLEHDNEVWSSTHRWVDGDLKVFNYILDDWATTCSSLISFYGTAGAEFIVIGRSSDG